MADTALRILFAAANPRETPPLRLGEEMRAIEDKIRSSEHRASFDLRSAWAVRADDLLQQMNEIRPNVLHISGHGAATGEVLLEDAHGAQKPVSPAALRALFESFGAWLQVVVLNACYSARQAGALVESVDVVIGMSEEIGDRAAMVFAASLYRALGFGESVGAAFRQGLAALQLEGLAGEEHTPDLLTRAGVDAERLTLVGDRNTGAAARRARDRAVPEALRQLLQAGTELISVVDPDTHESADGAATIFVVLRMRHSDAAYVVEADGTTEVGVAAEQLAHRLLPRGQARGYDWTLVHQNKEMKGWLTLETAGLRSGDDVLLHGNHRQPSWSPDYAS